MQAEHRADDRAVLDDETREDDGDDRDQFDEDVEGRAGGVLEGIADGVADDGGLVGLAALAAVVSGRKAIIGSPIVTRLRE